MSMTPDLLSLVDLKTNSTPVCLADHLVVEASHKGMAWLPLGIDKTIPSLVVPSLAKPLLSVAGLCDVGLTAVFTKHSCDLYLTSSVYISGNPVGQGYCRGNLLYLPSEPVSSTPSSSSISLPSVDNSLLGYHCWFSHLGLKPLKRLLKLQGISPSSMNEIAVHQCPVCVQTKMTCRPFKSRSPY
jgi:hypothetical protein